MVGCSCQNILPRGIWEDLPSMSDSGGKDQISPYPSRYFQRYDQNDDALFYELPLKVVHIDDGALAALGTVYAELLPRAGILLDLMSSWRTHLPSELAE